MSPMHTLPAQWWQGEIRRLYLFIYLYKLNAQSSKLPGTSKNILHRPPPQHTAGSVCIFFLGLVPNPVTGDFSNGTTPGGKTRERS